MYSREILPGKESLVSGGAFSYGSFDAPFARANILDVSRPYHYRLPHILKYLKVNEAQTFQVCSPEFFLYADLFNGKVFTLIYLNVYDRKEKRRWTYWRFLVGPRISLPDSLMDSETRFHDHCFKIMVKSSLAKGRIRFRGSVKNYRKRPDLRWDIEFDHSREATSPLVSSIPFGLNRAVYSYRAPGPGTGFLHLGDRRYRIEGKTSQGLFTDQKGYYPYIFTMDWVAGMGRDAKGRRVAFNLLDNHVDDQDHYNENALWIGNRMYPLPSIKVTRPQGPAGEWNIQDLEGMVDLSFTPEVRNSMHVNALFAESDYHGPFGSFRGFLVDGKGDKVSVDGFYGMGKKKRLRA